jgi:hypothetical protein
MIFLSYFFVIIYYNNFKYTPNDINLKYKIKMMANRLHIVICKDYCKIDIKQFFIQTK